MVWVQYLILGLGLAGAYGLTAQGLVVIHRGSGVINFANSGLGLVGAYVEYELHNGGVPTVLAVLAGLLAAAILGWVAHYGVMRRLWTAAQLTRVIATLGMLDLIDGLANLRIQQNQLLPPYLLPNRGLNIGGEVVSSYNFWLFGIAVATTVILHVVYKRTRFGLLTTAISENRRSASALGHSADLIAATNWALGSVLAAAAGILIAPLLTISVLTISLMLVPALAAAVMGGFVSFPITLLGAVLVGTAESFVQWANVGQGWPDAVPFVAVIVILLFKGTALPGRSFVQLKLPKVGSGRINWKLALAGVVVTCGMTAFVSSGFIGAMYGSAAFALILMSSVVVTGYAGQLSLAQLGLAGAGAFIGSRVAQAAGLGFWPALAIAIVGILPIGILAGIPAIRTRGVNLAIVTLGIGVIVDEVVITNVNYTGGIAGTRVQPPSLFGLSLNAETHPARYFMLSLAFVVVCAFAVANLRRSSVGRSLIALRGSERAAASLGLNVARLKLYAFAIGAVLATIGGMLIIYQAPVVNWSSGWDVISGIVLLGGLVIAGLGFTSGAIAAALAATVGVLPYLVGLIGTGVVDWITPAVGLGTILAIVKAPDGAIPLALKNWNASRDRKKRGAASTTAVMSPGEASTPVPDRVTAVAVSAAVSPLSGHTLELQGLSVRFGGVEALTDVSLSVHSGEVVGLIGPNGAGKTTLIDIVTGMTQPTSGDVRLDGRTLNRLPAAKRASAGLARSFQTLELFEDLTVRENILVASDRTRWWGYLQALAHPPRARLSPQGMAAIRTFGLEADLDRHPVELPYGRRRLVGIVRAVAGGASIVLLDEPAAGLDERESAELAGLLRMLVEIWGIGILLVEHDMALVMGASDRIAALDFGRVLRVGTPDEVRNDPNVVAAYLGEPVDEDEPSPAKELDASRVEA
jgi:ABC-type branched-subunit amino acid transport system ATPase component/branched-subunit amino acid ABC-type transport system permease component